MRAALLCLTVMLLAPAVCQAIGPGSCECLRISNTLLRISNIKSYYVQKSGLCATNAVVFTTVKGVQICSDPQKSWVKKAMKAVDGRRTTVSSKAIPETTAFSPTQNTTDDLGINGAPYNSFSLSSEMTVTMTHLVKENQMMFIPPHDNAEMLPEAGTSAPHTPSSAGQSFLVDTFQTLETATGLTTSLLGETYCLQKTED
ncbi:hypothetical protein MHYP_G00290700 [Metynnis hypsauchen]